MLNGMKLIGHITPKSSAEIASSRFGLGLEKIDRYLYDPTPVYDPLAQTGVKYVRIQSGWMRTEKEKGVYDWNWIDDIRRPISCHAGMEHGYAFATAIRFGRRGRRMSAEPSVSLRSFVRKKRRQGQIRVGMREAIPRKGQNVRNMERAGRQTLLAARCECGRIREVCEAHIGGDTRGRFRGKSACRFVFLLRLNDVSA